ncbi:hypothetical protein GCM10020220_063800 [Nonomuraea rubra]
MPPPPVGQGTTEIGPPTGYALRYDRGTVFTDGWVVLYNFGDAPVTITRSRPSSRGTGCAKSVARIAGYARNTPCSRR